MLENDRIPKEFNINQESFEDNSIEVRMVLIDINGEFSTEKLRMYLTKHYDSMMNLVIKEFGREILLDDGKFLN